MIYPGTFGGIPSLGSRNIEGTRICQADADTDADANGIRTETNMAPLTFGGGHKDLRIIICLRKFERTVERIPVCNVVKKLMEHGIHCLHSPIPIDLLP